MFSLCMRVLRTYQSTKEYELNRLNFSTEYTEYLLTWCSVRFSYSVMILTCEQCEAQRPLGVGCGKGTPNSAVEDGGTLTKIKSARNVVIYSQQKWYLKKKYK